MAKKSISEQFTELLPKGLDDIVRKNRDKVSFEVATPQDLKALEMPIVITNLQGILTSGFIYKWVVPTTGSSMFFMIGHINGVVRHTSNLLGWDPDQQVVLTRSGSHYILEEFVDPNSDSELLAGICAWCHRGPAGPLFGMPEWIF
jgi:hypothetical protein